MNARDKSRSESPSEPLLLLQECTRLLAEAGHEAVLRPDSRTLSAGAVRTSMVLQIDHWNDGHDIKPSEIVVQISKRDNDLNTGDEALERSAQPLERISAEIEAQVLQAVGAAGIAVASLLAAGYSPGLDADLLITGMVNGESIPRRVLRQLGQGNGTGELLVQQCARALARLHSHVPGMAIDGLPRFDSATQYWTHILDLDGKLDELTTPYPVLRYGLLWLGENVPADFPTPSLVHGDFRLGNLIVDDGDLKAVLDWELAHLGDPMCDLAWLCLRTWRFGADEFAVGGFGHMEDLRASYIESGGTWDDDRFAWWTVARTVWWGIGLASQAAAFIEDFSAGRAGSVVHAASGRRVVELEYDLLDLIGAHDGF